MSASVLIVGAGMSGAVFAREVAERFGMPSEVVEARGHVAGNCHTSRDAETGVMAHRYGPHIFHTHREDVWGYAGRFAEMMPFVNRVQARIGGRLHPLPINLLTLEAFFGVELTPESAWRMIESERVVPGREPCNFEEAALALVGRRLYEGFLKGYTEKQWGCRADRLPAALLKRLPVRFNDDCNYYDDPFQGIPRHGYTRMVENILDHPLITVRLNTPFEPAMRAGRRLVVNTGPLDAWFGHRHGRLGYRTVFWDHARHDGDHQGHAVINCPEPHVPHTRVIEHKHFAPWEHHDRTLVSTEFSRETAPGDTPFYPKRLAEDMDMLERYLEPARTEPDTLFLGRLATYRYLDMDDVIAEALDAARTLGR